MLNIAANPAITGAELRRIVAAEPTAPHASTIRRIGNLDVQLVRREQRWTLYWQYTMTRLNGKHF